MSHSSEFSSYLGLSPVQATRPGSMVYEDPKKRKAFDWEKSKGKNGKKETIWRLVLERIFSGMEKNLRGSLLASFENPKNIHELISDALQSAPPKNRYKQFELFSGNFTEDTSDHLMPIGITASEHNAWINALMQFILKIPSISEMFLYTAPSLTSFLDFIEIYKKDQREGKKVARASSSKLLESLRKAFTGTNFRRANPFQILSLIMDSIHDTSLSDGPYDLLAFYPSWRAFFTEKGSIEEKILALIHEQRLLPRELLIGRELSEESSIKSKGLITQSGDRYLLDAFIEERKDQMKSRFITYLQIHSVWYQCDDQRVIKVRPGNLQIALKKSVLFHYQIDL